MAEKTAAQTLDRSGAPVVQPPRSKGPVGAAPKLRRRPLLILGSVLAICLGAVLSGWLWTTTSGSTPVVAMRSAVARGEVIERSDLMAVQVGLDPALQVVPAGAAGDLIGHRAAVDLPAGSLVTRAAVAAVVVPAAGRSVVGVSTGAAGLPGEPLQVGDRVRVVVAPSSAAASGTGSATPWSIAAIVVGIHPAPDTGQQVISVDVPQESAVDLAGRIAGGGRPQIVLDSRER